jgi:hypothetical protein
MIPQPLALEPMFKFLTDLPLWVKILACFTIIPVYLLKDSIGTVIKTVSLKNIFKKKTKEVKNIEDLLVHDFFLSLKELVQKVEQIDFSHKNKLNTFKRKMMIELIVFKKEAIENSFTKILKQQNLMTISSQAFKYTVIGNITTLINIYNKQAVDSYVKMGVSIEDAEFFVNSYESYRQTIIDSFVNRLESICVSKQYSDNYERMLAMFEVLTVAVEVIPRDVKSLYFIINGKYDKYDINLEVQVKAKK